MRKNIGWSREVLLLQGLLFVYVCEHACSHSHFSITPPANGQLFLNYIIPRNMGGKRSGRMWKEKWKDL